MPVKPPDYGGIEAAMWLENATQVIPRLDKKDSDLLKRIKTYASRFDYESHEVEEKIRTDTMFAATFTKEPRRQSFHESVAQEWLQRELKIEIESLSAGGEKSVYVTSDGVVTPLPGERRKPSKSLDFRWIYKGVTFYAMHKYTKEGGGNQDSQFREMGDLLRNFQSASNPGIALIIIVDGAYYTKSKMDILRNLTRVHHPKSYAAHIENVPEIMDSYL